MKFRRYIGSTLSLLLLPVAALCSPFEAAGRTRASDAVATKSYTMQSADGSWRRMVTGRFRNGVRYAILPRTGNEPGVGLLIRNEGGFIAEARPGERGLAHLVEHIFFLSPTAKQPDDFRHLVRIGLPLTFPAPDAGSTSWRETNYYLSTRTTARTDLDTLLALFREAATDLSFPADAVAAGRAEVAREMAEKKLGNEIFAGYIAAVAPGSPGDVIDAQNSDDVPHASVATIRGLYRRLYQPRNLTVVVVGDVNAAQTKALIKKRFGDWKPATAVSAPTSYPMFQRDRIRPISFSALPQGRRTALMTAVMPSPAPPSTRTGQARAMLMDMLAIRAINDRLVAAQPDSPPGKVGIFIENGEQGHRLIMLWDNFMTGQWRSAVASLRKTACDLITTGFTTAEWAMAKQGLIADLARREGEMATVPNVELAKDWSRVLADGRYLIPASELLRFAHVMLPEMDARTGSDWWRRQLRSGAQHLRVEGPELAQVADPLAAIRTTANDAVDTPSCRLP